MESSLALIAAGFRHQASFRFGMFSGVITNTFFGLIRSAVFLALYRRSERVGGLDEADALTYVWILQAIFAVVWAPWMQELPGRIRSGEWTAELTRPGSPVGRHLLYDAGRTLSVIVLRAPIPLAFAVVAFDLRLPTTAGPIVLAILSVILSGVVGMCIRLLVGAIAFWTPDFRGVYALIFGPMWLLSGFTIPVQYFPGALRAFGEWGPLSALLHAPLTVTTGRAFLGPLLLQAGWAVVLVGSCSFVVGRATSRWVTFGG